MHRLHAPLPAATAVTPHHPEHRTVGRRAGRGQRPRETAGAEFRAQPFCPNSTVSTSSLKLGASPSDLSGFDGQRRPSGCLRQPAGAAGRGTPLDQPA